MKNNIQMIQINKAVNGSSFNAWMIKSGPNMVLGFIEKFKDTKTNTNPYKVFGAKLNETKDGFQYGKHFLSVYGTKKEAIEKMMQNCVVVSL